MTLPCFAVETSSQNRFNLRSVPEGSGSVADMAVIEPHGFPSTMIGQHDQIVDIDQRPCGESGEAAEACGYADGLLIFVGEEDQRRGMTLQAGDEALEHF